jgi:predicted RNA-binding Zn ribbon-like protein
MDETTAQAAALKLVSGELCLDFINTLGSHTSDQPREYLPSYAALVAWSQHASILGAGEAQQLLAAAAQRPEDAQATLHQARTVRTALYRIFAATARGTTVPADDLATLNHAVAIAMTRARIKHTPDGYVWTWVDDPSALDRMLWPIVRSAAELLIAGDLSRVRECAGETCGWLFVDTSKNRSRRWCDMQDCGNVAKVRRFRSRQRTDEASNTRT